MTRSFALLLAAALCLPLHAQDGASIGAGSLFSSIAGRPATSVSAFEPRVPSIYAVAGAAVTRAPLSAGNQFFMLATPSSGDDAPPGKGSMVGYIDDAVVGNQIRVRFDAAFDDNSPDRAEFFYAECGCDGGSAKGPKPGLATAINFQQLYLRGEFAPVKRVSFLFELPLRWVQPQKFDPRTLASGQSGFANQGGISDIQAGVKVAALAGEKQYLTLQIVGTFPSGDSAKGLGNHHYSIAPSLLYYRKLSSRFSVEGELGDWHPMNTDTPGFAGEVMNYGIGPSYELYHAKSIQIASVVELVGWRIFGGEWTNAQLIGTTAGAPIDTTDDSKIVNLKAGFRTSLGNHTSFYLGFGQALSQDTWYKHIIRLEYRRTF